MKKLFCVLFSMAVLLMVLPMNSFAAKTDNEKVELYGNMISVHAKQICLVKGDEEDDWTGSLFDSSFKKYYYVGDATVDFKEVAKKLPELQNLVVICSDVKNLSALQKLDDLVWLGLHQCEGSEGLGFLKKLPQLKKFRYTNIYSETPCKSINPISFLKNLTELYLNTDYTVVEDITPLKGLKKLKKLEIEHVSGDDVGAAIKNLKNLKQLTLDLNGRTDISFLSELSKLEELDISGDIIGTDTITKLPKLKSLTIGDTGEDLSFIGKMTNLEKLYLHYVDDSFAENISKLKNLKDLTLLDVNNGNRYDMSFLTELTALERLFIIGGTDLDHAGFSKLPKLKMLNIMLCEFETLAELGKCRSLENLIVYNCNSSFDVNWLKGSPVKEVFISGGGNGEIKNMESFAKLKKLQYLMLDFTGISVETAKAIKKALPNCKIEVTELSDGEYVVVIY